MDCEDIFLSGQNKSGIYKIWPSSRLNPKSSLDVYCDMDTDGGGWTVRNNLITNLKGKSLLLSVITSHIKY